MSIAVRLASAADLDDLIYLGRKTFIETYKGRAERPPGLEELYGQETFNAKKLLPHLENQHDLKQPVYALGLIDQQAVAYLKLDFDTPPDCVPNPNSVLLSKLYVLKAFQGYGLGRRLFEESCAIALKRGYSGLWLEVWDMNTEAIQFYEKKGFNTVGSAFWKFRHEEIDFEDNDLVMYRGI